MKANICSTNEGVTMQKLPYTNESYQQAVIDAKTKTEMLQAMYYKYISPNGGNSGGPDEYFDKLRKMGVIE